MRRDPRGITTPDVERTSCVVLAVISSPGFALRASTGLLSVAGMVVPAASSPAPLALALTDFPFTEAALSLLALPLASALPLRGLWLACAFASTEVLEFTLALFCPA